MVHLTDDAKELIAEQALNFAKEIFSREETEAAFQDWKSKRKETSHEVQSM